MSYPNAKMLRLFQEVAVRGGSLCNFTELARVLAVSKGAVTHFFGSGVDAGAGGSIPPEQHIGAIVREMNKAGVPVQLEWLYQQLAIFDAYLAHFRGTAPPIAHWPDTVRRHARRHDGLRYELPGRRGLRAPNAPTPATPSQFNIGDKVHLVLEPPTEFLTSDAALHAVLVVEDAEDIACLFPSESGNSAIGSAPLRLPQDSAEPYEVTGPAGIQRVYAVLTRFAPRSQVNAGLQEADLRTGLDVLASELASRPTTDWRMIGITVQVAAKT